MPLESEASFENFMKRRKHGKKTGARRGRGGDDSDESDEQKIIYQHFLFHRKREITVMTVTNLMNRNNFKAIFFEYLEKKLGKRAGPRSQRPWW